MARKVSRKIWHSFSRRSSDTIPQSRITSRRWLPLVSVPDNGRNVGGRNIRSPNVKSLKAEKGSVGSSSSAFTSIFLFTNDFSSWTRMLPGWRSPWTKLSIKTFQRIMSKWSMKTLLHFPTILSSVWAPNFAKTRLFASKSVLWFFELCINVFTGSPSSKVSTSTLWWIKWLKGLGKRTWETLAKLRPNLRKLSASTRRSIWKICNLH